MLRYRHAIRAASNLGQAQAIHNCLGNLAMVRSLVSLASGLDHLLSLGNDPLAPFRDVTMHAEETFQSEDGEINDGLDRQAVEKELRRYEEDHVSQADATSLVAFWEVETPTP